MRKKRQSSYYSKPLAQIHADFGGICAGCGNEVDLKDASRDHIIPRAAGGGNGRDNIQLMHKWCNNRKGHFVYPSDWRHKVEQLSVPAGYICGECGLPIKSEHKRAKSYLKIFDRGKARAVHKWCDPRMKMRH